MTPRLRRGFCNFPTVAAAGDVSTGLATGGKGALEAGVAVGATGVATRVATGGLDRPERRPTGASTAAAGRAGHGSSGCGAKSVGANSGGAAVGSGSKEWNSAVGMNLSAGSDSSTGVNSVVGVNSAAGPDSRAGQAISVGATATCSSDTGHWGAASVASNAGETGAYRRLARRDASLMGPAPDGLGVREIFEASLRWPDARTRQPSRGLHHRATGPIDAATVAGSANGLPEKSGESDGDIPPGSALPPIPAIRRGSESWPAVALADAISWASTLAVDPGAIFPGPVVSVNI